MLDDIEIRRYPLASVHVDINSVSILYQHILVVLDFHLVQYDSLDKGSLGVDRQTIMDAC